MARNKPSRANAHLGDAQVMLATALRRLPEAQGLLQKATQATDPVIGFHAHRRLIYLMAPHEDQGGVRASVEAALHAAREAKDPILEGLALTNLSLSLVVVGELNEARLVAGRAEQMLEDHPQGRWEHADAAVTRAMMDNQADPAEGLPALYASLELASSLGALTPVVYIQNAIAGALTDLRRRDEALEFYDQAARASQGSVRCAILGGRARCLGSLGRNTEAEIALKEAWRLASELGLQRHCGEVQAEMGRLHMVRGDLEAAKACLASSLEYFGQSLPHRRFISRARQAMIAAQQGDLVASQEELRLLKEESEKGLGEYFCVRQALIELEQSIKAAMAESRHGAGF